MNKPMFEIPKKNKPIFEIPKKTLADNLRNYVKNWKLIFNYYDRPNYENTIVLRCFSIFNYYPTKVDFIVSDNDWNIRNLIWDFKANPNNNAIIEEIVKKHKNALESVVPSMKFCLEYFFGNCVNQLTLVCIPSSKKNITERRYHDFSTKICKELGMGNAYDYINVIKDGDSKHYGGVKRVKYSIDENYFRDKNVIIFDDIITTGRSMLTLKEELEHKGANVICGFSIGKTKHHNDEKHQISEIKKYYYIKEEPENYISDLPF